MLKEQRTHRWKKYDRKILEAAWSNIEYIQSFIVEPGDDKVERAVLDAALHLIVKKLDEKED